MRLLGRLILGAFGLLVAVPVGAVVLLVGLFVDPGASAWLTNGALAGFDMAASDIAAGSPPEGLFLLVAGLAEALFVLIVLPPTIVGLSGAVFGARGMLWYGASCGILTAAVPWLARGGIRPGAGGSVAAELHLSLILFVVGASAGLVYGLIAGRGDGGADRELAQGGHRRGA